MRVDLGDDEGVEVQMAPLIDCVFLLLIFFLVATTLKEMHREIPITLPRSDAAVEVETKPETLILGIDRFGQKYVNGQAVTVTAVFEQVRLARQMGKTVRFDIDEDTPYKRFLELYEICRVEGVNNVGLHTSEDKPTP